MDSFARATALDPSPTGGFTWDVPDGWQQGRGAWGGLVVGALTRAVRLSEPDPSRVVRSISAQLVAPAVVGPLDVQVAALRRGSAVSTWSASATDRDGRLVASLVGVLGSPRLVGQDIDFTDWGTLSPPDVLPPAEVERLDLQPPLGPVFLSRMDMRPVRGVPMSGEEADCLGWVDFAERVDRTAESLLALVDAWWPASFPRMLRPHPVATVNFTAHLLVDALTVPGGTPLLSHSFVSSADEGFTSETRRLWTADGRMAVDNLQSIVYIA